MNAILCDGNRTNQAFFQMNTLSDQQWLGTCGTILYFEFAQFVKNIRNIWLNEEKEEQIKMDMEFLGQLNGKF